MQRHRVIRARPTVARARKDEHPLGPIAKGSVIADSEMHKINGKFCKPPSCWNLEHACPRPESDFCLTPPPEIQPQPSNAAEMEAPLWRVASRRVNTSTCAITRSRTDPFCRKVTGPVWRRCAQIARSAYWRVLLASPRLKDLESFSVKMRL